MKPKSPQKIPETKLHLLPVQSLPVLHASDFTVTHGANQGDGMSTADEMMNDDVYILTQNTQRHRLSIQTQHNGGSFIIDASSEVGTPGAQLHLDCSATVMSPDSTTIEIIVLVEVDEDGAIADIFLLPLADLAPKTDYTLIGVATDTARVRFAEIACVSFARGTRVTMADGRQVPIEDLQVGDRVLTRDSGPQDIRWIGQDTVRAVGAFAPIVITKGTLHNENDLIVSPNHRLFVYQRNDALKLGRSEVLVKAKFLVNGDTVYRQDGGFVDYFQLLFDTHQIIYAEGIAAETLLIDTRTKPVLPPDLAQRLANILPSHGDTPHRDYEVLETALDSLTAVEVLRRASAS